MRGLISLQLNRELTQLDVTRRYQDYLEQLTFLLFLKMADERAALTGEAQAIPKGYRWDDLANPKMEGAGGGGWDTRSAGQPASAPSHRRGRRPESYMFTPSSDHRHDPERDVDAERAALGIDAKVPRIDLPSGDE